ncbi:hypothetical protein DY000_02056150 [Brassica cretica]|uniref:H(+)-transporting two-sector ATPase n=1 Tax=Brassica cretica TaxID=69181 RepID=A0ABQ7AK58_BRACR|nr:hypothetical protein DY000_02056150 [Brassica cretica]
MASRRVIITSPFIFRQICRQIRYSTSSPAAESSAPAKDEAKKTYDYGGKGVIGKVCQVNGVIFDVRFEDQEGLPPIMTSLEVKDHPTRLLPEVSHHSGQNVVRTITGIRNLSI